MSVTNPQQASQPRVAVCMGSDSDWPTMQAAAQALAEFDVAHQVQVLSAHRMPHEMVEFGSNAAQRGLQ
ncbi:MAG: AIR carboxylase family protein, partial [Actinomycetales bacterium]